jgi:tetrahydromethanopterin S-methyltransferase subunit F
MMKERINDALNKLKELWKAHGRDITLFAGVFLVGVIGFEIGFTEGQSLQSKPLVIDAPATPVVSQVESATAPQDGIKTIVNETIAKNQNDPVITPSCQFVGSKNSNKYHLPTCSFAKRIKPENRVCFASEEDAKSKGYTAGCLK